MLQRNVYTVHRVYFGHTQIHIVDVSIFLSLSNDQRINYLYIILMN